MHYDITTPSQYHTALVERLRVNLVEGLAIESYDEWGKVEIKGPTILIQWEDSHPGQRQNDGRYNHQFMLTAHCIIPKGQPNALLQALDLAAEVERLLERRALFKAPAAEAGHATDTGQRRHQLPARYRRCGIAGCAVAAAPLPRPLFERSC